MATNDLSNKEQITLNYITEVFKQLFPNLDTSPQGAFMETFGLSHVKLLTPLIDYADRVKLTQSLDNANLMTTAEMDAYAAGKFMYRNVGSYAVGYVILSFDDIPANGTLQIPAGTEAQSKQGYLFSSLNTVILTMDDLAGYYDPAASLYNIPVFFQAENPGAEYNVNEGDITNLVLPMNNLVSVTNLSAFTGGVDYEDNQAFAERIKITAMTPNLGVDRGWQRFARSFSQVKDVIVAGYGHPLMRRDIIGTFNPGTFNANVDPNVHWGGKVDLHVRGTNLQPFTETLTLSYDSNGNLIAYLGKKPVWDVLQITFSSSRYTDPSLDSSFFIVQGFVLMKDENPETVGTLGETAWVIIKDARLNDTDAITVQYRYNQLLTDMNDALYTEDNRPPGTDVLLKEAPQKFVHGSIIVKLSNITGLQETNRSVIRQRLYSWIDALQMGAELQFSDISEPIYSYDSTTVDTIVDYISLPSQYLVTDNDNQYIYYCLSQKKQQFLDQVMGELIYFNQWIPYYRDNLTVYDFFDILHTLSLQNTETNAWNQVSMINNNWGKYVWYINTAKMMLAYVNSLYRLSPAKWTPEENQYFALGYLAVYEDITYTSNDIQTLINTLLTMANPGAQPSDYVAENILHLLVYCSVMIYTITSDNFGGLDLPSFNKWLIDLTRGTPIDYQVNG